MPERHLSHVQLKQLLDGDLSAREMRAARSHLVDCGDCEQEISLVLADLPQAQRKATGDRLSAALPARKPSRRRKAARLGAALDSLLLTLEEERAQAGQAFQPLPATEEDALCRAELCTWGFFERVLDEGRTLLSADPQRAQTTIQLALKVAERLDTERYGERIVETARFRGWANLGNVRRVLGDFDGAEKAFRRAEFHYWASDLDPLDEATLLQFRAVLRRYQRRFDEALELIDDARAICREVRETHREGRALLARAIIDLLRGQPELAAREFDESHALLDPAREPKLPFFCRFNQVICLTETDRPEEAEALLREVRGLAADLVKDPMSQLRIRWMEARVAWGLGRLEEAEPALRSLQKRFQEEGLQLESALVSLDLAALLVRAGRHRETQELVEATIPLFQSLRIEREGLAALIVLQQAAASEQVTLALVRETLSKVRGSASDQTAQPKS